MALGGKAFFNNTVYLVRNYSGAALWLPPNTEPDIDILFSLLQNIPNWRGMIYCIYRILENGFILFQWDRSLFTIPWSDLLYPDKELWLVLMNTSNKIFDNLNTLAPLDSSDTKNILFRQRHGFELDWMEQLE